MKKSKTNGAPALGLSYLFTGFVKQSAKDPSRFVAEKEQSIDILRNQVIFINSGADGAKTVWTTNNFGLLSPSETLHDRNPGHGLSNNSKFYFPRQSVLKASLLSGDVDWQGLFKEFFSLNEDVGVVLPRITIEKKHLRQAAIPEDINNENDDLKSVIKNDQDFIEWHKKLDKRISGFVVPKRRVILFMFSSDLFSGLDIEVVPPAAVEARNLDVLHHPDFGSTFAFMDGGADQLPIGNYKVKVNIKRSESKFRWCHKIKKDGYYEISEPVRFRISEFGVDFDIINCDPISLEEATLLQFPGPYPHIIREIRSVDYIKQNTQQQITVSPQVNPLASIVHWTQFALNSFADFTNADKGWDRSKNAMLAVQSALEKAGTSKETTLALTMVTASIKMYAKVQDWDKLYKKYFKADELYKRAKEVVRLSDLGVFAKTKWYKELDEELFEYLKKLKDNPNYYRNRKSVTSKIFRNDAHVRGEGRNYLAKYLHKGPKSPNLSRLKKVAGGAAKAAAWIDRFYSAYELAMHISNIIGIKGELKKNNSLLNYKLEMMDQDFHGVSREVIEMVERHRLATVTGRMNLEVEEAQALQKSLDMVVGSLVLVPVIGEIVAIYLLLEATKDLVVTIATNTYTLYDDYLNDGRWQENKNRRAFYGRLHLADYANQMEMPSSKQLMDESKEIAKINQSAKNQEKKQHGKYFLNLQFRLRAAALHGLIGLITRAALSINNTEKNEAKFLELFREKLKAYKVQSYFDVFLSSEAKWSFPIKSWIPISMDTHWLHVASDFNKAYTAPNDGLDRVKSEGDTSDLTGKPLYQNAGIMLSQLFNSTERNVEAEFHNVFPIHYMNSKSIEEFALKFKTDYSFLDAKEYVDYSVIYFKPEGAKKEDRWQLLSDIYYYISPFAPLRIVVVLKKNLPTGEDIVPCSFQLRRLDGLDIYGPLYKSFTQKLDKHILLEEEQDWIGRMGVVFSPFYNFGKTTYFGTKVMNRSDWAALGLMKWPSDIFDDNDLGKMHYDFRFKMGGEVGGNWLDLDIGRKRLTSKANRSEFSVSLDLKKEKHAMLNTTEFLRNWGYDFPYPDLFEGSARCHALYIKIGDGEYRIASDKNLEAITRLEHFDWSKPVTFVVVVHAGKLRLKEYKTYEYDFRSLPVSAVLSTQKGFRTYHQGPQYPGTLHYIGKRGIGSQLSSDAKISQGATTHDFYQFIKQPQNQNALYNYLATLTYLKQEDFYFFAAAFEMKYVLPQVGNQEAKVIKGIKPVADKPLVFPDYYEFSLRNLISPGKSGLQVESIESTHMEPNVAGAMGGVPLPPITHEFKLAIRAPYFNFSAEEIKAIGNDKTKAYQLLLQRVSGINHTWKRDQALAYLKKNKNEVLNHILDRTPWSGLPQKVINEWMEIYHGDVAADRVWRE